MKSLIQTINESLESVNESRMYELSYAGLLDTKTDKFQYGALKGEKLSNHFKRDDQKLTLGYNSSTGSYVVTPLLSSTPKDFSYEWKTDRYDSRDDDEYGDNDQKITEFIQKVKIMTYKEVYEFAKTNQVQYYY